MSKREGPDFKTTLNLPTTKFPMRASLPTREPEILARWERERLYERCLEARAGGPRYVLHDGPPYANGDIHLGHALNKVIKDVVVKYKTMTGCYAPYVPGWDCHGLPIELEVEKRLGKKAKAAMPKLEVRRLCREHAERFLDAQRRDFKRLGILGDWGRPYRTMDAAYEAVEVRELAKLVASGDLYRGKKPVYWCGSCRTALAEAEVEYEEITSEAVYVGFPFVEPYPDGLAGLGGQALAAVIWTTTPWTLPANLAIAVHPDIEYAVVRDTRGAAVLVARALLPRLAAFVGTEPEVLATLCGRDLEGARTRHPWIARDAPIVLGDHVTLEAGTGLVHTAPGHGQEDYEVGLRYDLEVYAPVDDRGRFADDVASFGGLDVFDANPRIVEHLRAGGRLLAAEPLTHTYPHCWRCKHPIVFRATEQWFISMEATGLRQRALDAIERVTWVPPWGRDRIAGMVATRPDWCISRQRAWGVPIVALRCRACGEARTGAALLEHVAAIFERETSDAWFARDVDGLVPPGFTCPCGATDFEKEEDILDVWVDSGVSFAAVVERRPELGGRADLYVEGSDQHRGWFQSALITSVGTRERPPYDTVLTHGFILDKDGRKMSKSLGNVVAPQELVARYGADILRLWVAAEDYRDDVRISDEIIERAVEAYRRIRNTARFLLGNLADFDLASDPVPPARLEELDRFVLDRLQGLIERCRRAYDRFEFHTVYHALNNFCAVDLSALYLDIVKDRLYCEAPSSATRRAAQTTLFRLLDALARIMAPVLSFTAEEIWGHLPADPARPSSVLLADFPTVDPDLRDGELARDWERLLEVRNAVTKTLEGLRQRGEVGHSLEARVELAASDALRPLLTGHHDQLSQILIVSEVAIAGGEAVDGEGLVPGLAVRATRAAGTKCPRCWNYRTDTGQDTRFPEVCGRCARVLGVTGVARPSA